MKLYHSTSASRAQAILADGFRDEAFMGVARGVFFADRPLLPFDGVAASAEVTLEVMPSAALQDEWELIEEGRPEDAYREWLVPADVANTWPCRLLTEDERAEID